MITLIEMMRVSRIGMDKEMFHFLNFPRLLDTGLAVGCYLIYLISIRKGIISYLTWNIKLEGNGIVTPIMRELGDLCST